MKGLISTTIKDRKDAISTGEESFSPEYIEQFKHKVDAIVSTGWEQYKADNPENKTRGKTKAKRKKGKAKAEVNHPAQFEKALLRRLGKYRQNYFLWVEDFRSPTTNNCSERGLRGAKTKLKVSGQFENIGAATNYARLRSYIETCRRNGINEITALERLTEGRPYTVNEILQGSPPK